MLQQITLKHTKRQSVKNCYNSPLPAISKSYAPAVFHKQETIPYGDTISTTTLLTEYAARAHVYAFHVYKQTFILHIHVTAGNGNIPSTQNTKASPE